MLFTEINKIFTKIFSISHPYVCVHIRAPTPRWSKGIYYIYKYSPFILHEKNIMPTDIASFSFLQMQVKYQC